MCDTTFSHRQLCNKQPSTVELMKHNIRAYNKCCTEEYLDKLSPLELLLLTAPLDRRDFAVALYKEHLVRREDVLQFILY